MKGLLDTFSCLGVNIILCHTRNKKAKQRVVIQVVIMYIGKCEDVHKMFVQTTWTLTFKTKHLCVCVCVCVCGGGRGVGRS